MSLRRWRDERVMQKFQGTPFLRSGSRSTEGGLWRTQPAFGAAITKRPKEIGRTLTPSGTGMTEIKPLFELYYIPEKKIYIGFAKGRGNIDMPVLSFHTTSERFMLDTTHSSYDMRDIFKKTIGFKTYTYDAHLAGIGQALGAVAYKYFYSP